MEENAIYRSNSIQTIHAYHKRLGITPVQITYDRASAKLSEHTWGEHLFTSQASPDLVQSHNVALFLLNPLNDFNQLSESARVYYTMMRTTYFGSILPPTLFRTPKKRLQDVSPLQFLNNQPFHLNMFCNTIYLPIGTPIFSEGTHTLLRVQKPLVIRPGSMHYRPNYINFVTPDGQLYGVTRPTLRNVLDPWIYLTHEEYRQAINFKV